MKNLCQKLSLVCCVLFALVLPDAVRAKNYAVVAQSNFSFSPSHLTLEVGDSVTFSNGGGLHNVASIEGGFRCANGCDGQGGDGTPSVLLWSFTLTFDEVGTFPYVCEPHAGLGMTGTLVVVPATGGSESGELTFESDSVMTVESSDPVSLVVSRVNGDDGAVSVDYATVEGSAESDLDFVASSGTLTWTAGDDTSRSIQIGILEDATTESNETFSVELTNPTGGAILREPSSTTVTIIDDDVVIPLCVADDNTLCLNEGRFAVSIDWRDFAGRTGKGRAIPFTSDTGFFWFFAENNLEVIIKVLNACNSEFDSYWVFFAVASNVEYTITVTDTVAGVSKVYTNPLGGFAPATGDTAAFPTCP